MSLPIIVPASEHADSVVCVDIFGHLLVLQIRLWDSVELYQQSGESGRKTKGAGREESHRQARFCRNMKCFHRAGCLYYNLYNNKNEH